jgi:hypothetical protein
LAALADEFSRDSDWRAVYRGDRPDPAAFAAYLAGEGVDHAGGQDDH